MKPLRIAVIGTGKRAGAHLATLTKLTDILCLAAVCDINEEQLKPVALRRSRALFFAERHNVPSYTDVEKMLATEKPDIVLIADGAVSARKDMEILIATRESARKGSIPIELPLKQITEHEQEIEESYRLKYGHSPLEIGTEQARTAY